MKRRSRRILGAALLWLDVHVFRCRWYPLCRWSDTIYGPLTPAEIAALPALDPETDEPA